MNAVRSSPPNSDNYHCVLKALIDPFLEAKLHFILSVSNNSLHFSKFFYTDELFFPFLCKDLCLLMTGINIQFLKKVNFIVEKIPVNMLEANQANIKFGVKAMDNRRHPESSVGEFNVVAIKNNVNN